MCVCAVCMGRFEGKWCQKFVIRSCLIVCVLRLCELDNPYVENYFYMTKKVQINYMLLARGN
uniref:Uncharacterized protein n=1 Tax=Anguilla anguilla TaxID=7936 RepID=A0A0E9P829_ANGAN